MPISAARASFLISSPDFRNRVRILMVRTAVMVYAEAVATPAHAERAAYATEILNAPEQFENRFVETVATQYDRDVNPEGPTDAEILTILSSVFNALAGVTRA